MNSDFSERQYETAVNIELSTGLGSYTAPVVPVVPSSNEEAETGWDALFKLGVGYWYFLQYKVVFLGSRRTGKNTRFWDLHNGPYFRFELHSDSKGECRQHRLLTELRDTQPGVYYCVPTFIKEEELWSRVRTSSVFDGSRLIDLADVRLRDCWGNHQITFDEAGLVQPWSEPGEASRSDRSTEIRHRPENRREMTTDGVARLFSDVSRIVGRSIRSRLGTDALDSWVQARSTESTFEPLRRGLDADEGVADLLAASSSGPDLVAITAQVLQLDLGLTWVIEPVE